MEQVIVSTNVLIEYLFQQRELDNSKSKEET